LTPTYDPRAHGARCEVCPLNGNPFVPPEYGSNINDIALLVGQSVAVVGEAPGEQEERQRRPFVGPSGVELNKGLHMAGIDRRDCLITNALLCLTGDTKVRLADGSLERINKLVKDRYDGEVLSVDDGGCIVPRKVVGWHKNPRAGRRLYKVTTAGAKGNSRGIVGPILTEDHPVLTKRGWVQVGDLRPSDLVAVGDKALGPVGEAVAIGSLLGDGSVTQRSLVVSHAEDQQEWLRAKAKVFNAFGCTVEETPIKEEGWQDRVSFRTRPSRWFLQLQEQLEERKLTLSPRALAVWWLDDGYLRVRENRRISGEINQTKLDEETLDWLIGQLAALGITATRNKRRLYFPHDGMKAMSALISPLVPLSMQHKLLPEHRGRYDAGMWRAQAVRHCWDTANVAAFTPRPDVSVYCIDVEETANFLTADAVVHNCRPPKNRLRELLTKINKLNKEMEREYKKKAKEAKKGGESVPKPPDYIQSPIDCCKPRLDKELEPFQHFITLGGTGTKAVTGANASVMKVRGGLMHLEATMRTPERKVMPTLHPAFCLRQPRWFHVFRNDLHKAGKWFRGESEWVPPAIIRQPDLGQLEAFLMRHEGEILTYDIETDGIEPLHAKIRCIAIGTAEEVIVLSFLSKNGTTRFYHPTNEIVIVRRLARYFEDATQTKYGWNSITYDSAVLRAQWGCRVVNHIDGILLHRSVESELPHGLGYVGSMYTDAPSWKHSREGNKLSTDSESDEELATYCCLDVAITARVLPPLVSGVQLRDQVEVFRSDSKVQQVCKAMHQVGMHVDQGRRLKIEKELLGRRYELLNELRGRLGNNKFNPGSVYQVRDILFDKWGLEAPLDDKERLTASDDPSTADIVLRALLTDRTVSDDRRAFIKLLRYYRKVQKILGTYVVKLRPWNVAISDDLGWDDDDDWVDKETRERYGLEKKGIVNPRTGRMYPGWSASVAVTGRLSSSKPINAMNFPHALRGMVTARPGNVLVGADADQLEIRVAAAVWQIEKYLLAFREGMDPHSMTAFLIFGEAFCAAAGIDPAQFETPGKLVSPSYDERGVFIGKGEAKSLRKLSKNVHFASVCSEEKVALIGDNPEVPISKVKPGDWTWAWSKKRERYEPTRVKHVWNHGIKKCLKVTLGWGQGNQWTCSVVLTPDHPFIMRDGTLRHAGSLRIGDRVMPFRRAKSKAKGPAGHSYFHVHPFNDARKVGAHRVVRGFYEAGQNKIHVHHVDGNGLNNHPDNLEALGYLDHYREHEEAMAEGRRNSEKWQASVANPKVNRDPVKKAAAAKKGGETRRGQLQKSKLAPWADGIGVLSDAEVAAQAGCTREAVAYYRQVRSIPPPVGQRGWLKWLLTQNDNWRRLLCEHSNQDLAELVEEEFGIGVTRQAVNHVRKAAGIPAPSRSRKGERQKSKLDPWAERIGHEADRVIAAAVLCTPEAVAYYRKTRGIPAYWKEAPGGNNHVVLAIEEVGEREVWDIEVDHEDHNFALASGVFVHNSQYMAGVERVHKMIQSAESPNDDGTTELPYALLPLRRVRQMHEKWMEGAPEYKAGWERDVNEWKAKGYLREPVGGRRRDFLDSHGGDEAVNEIVNHKIQGGAAAWMNKALIEIYEQIPEHKWGDGTGIINQCHDHIVVECPESAAPWVSRVIETAMNGTHPGVPGVNLTATADVGPSWDKV